MKKLLILCLVASIGIPLMSSAQQEIAKHYSGIESLDIHGGPLEVSYTGLANQKDIDIIAFLGEEEEREKELFFVRVGDVLKVAYNPSRKFANYDGPKRYVKIIGPENMVLEVKNSSGQIVVDNVRGEKTRLSVSSGQIKASNIKGDCQLF